MEINQKNPSFAILKMKNVIKNVNESQAQGSYNKMPGIMSLYNVFR